MVKTIRIFAVLGIALGLGACGVSDQASRNTLSQPSSITIASQNAARIVTLAPKYDIAEIRVSVPETLRVSEANLFFPVADIVWRGEPIGNRHQQVKAMFDDGLAEGTRGMTIGPKVVVNIEVERFHSLTEKTRYTFGGVHSMHFAMTVRDAATGQVIDGPRQIVADVKGAGGSRAIAEERAGRTQRVVIVERLAQVIRRELSREISVPATPLAADGYLTSRSSNDMQLIPALIAY